MDEDSRFIFDFKGEWGGVGVGGGDGKSGGTDGKDITEEISTGIWSLLSILNIHFNKNNTK